MPTPSLQSGQHLAYTGSVDIALRGPFSGRVYRVGPDARQIDADARDVAALLGTGQFHAWPDSPLGLGLDQRFYRALYLPSDGLYAVGAKMQMTLIAKTKQPKNIQIAWPQTNLRRVDGSEHTLTKSGIFADRLVLVLVYDEPRGNCPQAAL